MYNESGFSVKDFILKIILVVLFVFLLMWLFPMPNLKPVYDRIYADNIETMKDAAKSYYTVERLPKDVNDSVRMTLNEMLAMKLLLPIADSDDVLCDGQASFVEIMKSDTEYIVKTNLTCSNKSDYVIEYMGCYDLCGDKCVEEEAPVAVAPTVKKTTKTVVKQPVKKDPVKKPVVEYVTMYQLKRDWYKGYTTNTTAATTQYKHVKYGTETVFKGYDYSCPSGYGDRQGDTCYKYDTDYEYTCSEGTLVGSQCKTTTTTYSYSCPSGYSQSGSGSNTKCSKEDSTSSYYCTTGTLVGSQCKVANVTYSYSCPSGYSQSGSSCSKSVYNGTSKVYQGTGEGKYIPSSNSTYSYVSTGARSVKDCNACASYYVYTYKIYKNVASYSTVYASPISTPTTTYSYVPAKLNSSSNTTTTAPIVTPKTKTHYSSAQLNTSTDVRSRAATKTAQYDYRTYVEDSKWTYNSYEKGYTMVDQKTIPGDTTKVYTPDWVLTLPAGYVRTEINTEYKWSNTNAENGWIYTGVTKKIQK
ncbi:MAG: hypothetical protein PHD78_00955 [Bacilli bacterium]|nr:hypothetical protein [Bacilli bacterium]MDD4053348.1 hypothetical protein [Bacilli bacterium]MDD4411005.1 hypothetical protein [Bacilli bacterium]